MSLGKPKDQAQDQKAEIKSLPGMEDYGEPVAAVTLASECHQPTEQDVPRYAPRHVEMIQSEDNAVRDPIPSSKDAFHLGQQHSAEQEFFTQEVVEYRRDHKESEEIPCANPASPQFRGEQGIQAAALGFRQEGEELCSYIIEKRCKSEFQCDDKKHQRDEQPPQPVIILARPR